MQEEQQRHLVPVYCNIQRSKKIFDNSEQYVVLARKNGAMVDKDIINEILINKMKKIALISGITGQDGSFLG